MRQLQDEVIGPGIRFLEEEAPSLCAPSSQTASHKSESLKAGNGADLARSSPPLGLGLSRSLTRIFFREDSDHRRSVEGQADDRGNGLRPPIHSPYE